MSPESRETTQTNKDGPGMFDEHYSKTGVHNISSSLTKRENTPNGSVPPYGSKYNKRRSTSLDLKTKVVRLGDVWQVSVR